MIELILPWPPSSNTYWRSVPYIENGKAKTRVLISEKGRAYRKAVYEIALVSFARKGYKKPINFLMACVPPDRRKRDGDNLLKAVWDSMTHAGVWVDDSQVKDYRVVMRDPSPKWPGGGVWIKAYEMEVFSEEDPF